MFVAQLGVLPALEAKRASARAERTIATILIFSVWCLLSFVDVPHSPPRAHTKERIEVVEWTAGKWAKINASEALSVSIRGKAKYL